jgi:hypothetical protein
VLAQALDDERPFEHVESLAGGVHGDGVSWAPVATDGPEHGSRPRAGGAVTC